MIKIEESQRIKTVWQRILNYFLRGLIVLLPFALTAGIVIWLIRIVKSTLGLNNGNYSGQELFFYFVLGIGFIILIGFLVKGFVAQQILDFFEGIIEKAPGLKFIFGTSRDMTEAFMGDKKKFDTPVLVEVQSEIFRLGFVTQNTLKELELEGYCSVYLPYSYGFNGELILVPTHKVKKVNKESSEITKFVISGGVASFD